MTIVFHCFLIKNLSTEWRQVQFPRMKFVWTKITVTPDIIITLSNIALLMKVEKWKRTQSIFLTSQFKTFGRGIPRYEVRHILIDANRGIQNYILHSMVTQRLKKKSLLKAQNIDKELLKTYNTCKNHNSMVWSFQAKSKFNYEHPMSFLSWSRNCNRLPLTELELWWLITRDQTT